MALTQLKTGAIADDAVTGAKIANDTVAEANIANDAIGLTELKAGTDGQIITYDASGNPVAVGPGTDGQVLTSTGAGSPPAFEAIPASGKATNLVINGAMQVAQRGTSSTSSGYHTVDRWTIQNANTGVTVTQSQQATSSSDEPYQNGFQNFARIALASAGTANTNVYVEFQQRMEAQNIANSGWNFKSSSSNITVSFWFRASTNQTFYGYLTTSDGTAQRYTFSFTASGNNTWTKITKTISGNSNLDFNNDNGEGLHLVLVPFYGTDLTNNKTLNTWAASDNTNFMPDMASTWLTAGASTFDITGVLLEVGDSASDYPHESYADTLAKCQRYYYTPLDGTANAPFASGTMSYAVRAIVHFPVAMRAAPSIVASNFTDAYYYQAGSTTDFFDTMSLSQSNKFAARIQAGGNVSNPSDGVGILMASESTSAVLGFNSEL